MKDTIWTAFEKEQKKLKRFDYNDNNNKNILYFINYCSKRIRIGVLKKISCQNWKFISTLLLTRDQNTEIL